MAANWTAFVSGAVLTAAQLNGVVDNFADIAIFNETQANGTEGGTFTSGVTITSLAQELAIEGIQHEIDLSTGHRITLFTSPTTLVFELILDDAVYGTIDTENVLG